MYDDYFFYVCVILSLIILGVSLHTIYKTKTKKMSSTGSYNKGLKQKSIYEDALYFEQGEIKRQLESLPNHGWFAKFMHKLFNSFVPDHKSSIERSLKKVSKSKPDVRPGNQNPILRDTTTYLNIPNPPKPTKRKI